METLKRNSCLETPFIEGELVLLRGLKKSDLTGNMSRWANDNEVTQFMVTGLKPNVLELMEEEYEKLIRSDQDVVLAVIAKESNVHIGNAGLYAMNAVSRSAEYRIILGEKDYWGKGYGKEVGRLLLDYGFNKLNLNKIWLGVNTEHLAAVNAYKKVGFVEEGILRQETYRNGRYYDAMRMSVLREEYGAS